MGDVGVLGLVVQHCLKKSDQDGKDALAGRLSPRALCACNIVES